MSETVLHVEGLTKRFPGLLALDTVRLELRAHEVVGLIGENGAGKSTLLKILAGLHQPDAGSIVLRGKPVSFRSVADAANAGVGMVFQEQSLLPNISVAENILLGQEGSAVRLGCYRWRELNRRARIQLGKINSDIPPEAPTEMLSFAQRQMVELAKVLAIEGRSHHEPVILLDEPTSVLEADDVEMVLAQIRRLRTIASVIFVSHRLEEVLRVSDRVYVMTNGRCVAEREPRRCEVNELQQLMLGRELTAKYRQDPETSRSSEQVVRLSVVELSLRDRYERVSFNLRKGEVLGFAGVQGSGREDLCRTLFGIEAPDSGQFLFDGKAVQLRTPADAVAVGIGYIPAERRTEGIITGLSVKENMTLAHIDAVQRGPLLNRQRERRLVMRWIERLRIKTPSPDTLAANLSGGNQQKVVVAKWLIAQEPKLLILDHPMRGLDVGAKAEVFALIRRLAADGIAILLIADSLEELIALSHRIIVMRDGQISGEFPVPTDVRPLQLAIVERMV